MSSNNDKTYYKTIRERPVHLCAKGQGQGQPLNFSPVRALEERQPKKRLPLLESGGYLPRDLRNIHACIDGLIEGPESIDALKNKWEPELVQHYEPDSLGYVWAALASFGLAAPLVEDATVRLASCFIRCVLNYGQRRDKTGPVLCFRDERRTYSYAEGKKQIHAVDDGSIRLMDPVNTSQHVAMLEVKRTFEKVIEGDPSVSDELLAQMVGETLALRCGDIEPVSQTDFITILAVTHFVRFFHFHISDDFYRSYQELLANNSDNLAGFLRIDSTVWLDIKKREHREDIASHILALVAWAKD
ncbi:hypothetical protein HRG_004378 [Hirsutella rhossiliensis]|uniref:Uncharacterized protein n=1 Tax=Hirsutella rhossiliensis TaxID=111463 RepID=A0A9P8SJP9_9HYPO|nr:uncharacterized protein HRG_04378 [Hirsutella rhossiliensis]KAH0963950.1 hypothetical protein HRG_04378 [Hirsutella rhossiliensis]